MIKRALIIIMASLTMFTLILSCGKKGPPTLRDTADNVTKPGVK